MAEVLAARRAVEARHAIGLATYDLGMGEAPFAPSKVLKSIAAEAIQTNTRYGSCAGSAKFQHACAPDLVLTGNGLKPLICILQSTFVAEARKAGQSPTIWLVVPYWPGYASYATAHGLPIQRMWPNSSHEMKLTPDAVRDTLDGVSGPHLVMLCTPGNPTGAVYTQTEMDALAVAFAEHNVIVFEDRIYSKLVPTGTEVGTVARVYDRVITGHSLSKCGGAGGWRFGHLRFNNTMGKLHAACVHAAGITYSAPSPAFESIAVAMETSECSLVTAHNATQFVRGWKCLADSVGSTLLTTTPTQGAWYTLVDFNAYRVPFETQKITTSGELAAHLGNIFGIVVLPGTAFGLRPDNLCVRVSLIACTFEQDDSGRMVEVDWSPLKEVGGILTSWLKQYHMD